MSNRAQRRQGGRRNGTRRPAPGASGARTAPAPAPFVGPLGQLALVVDDVDEDELVRLEHVRRAREMIDAQELEIIARAKYIRGYSWSQIAVPLWQSRQAVQQRFERRLGAGAEPQ